MKFLLIIFGLAALSVSEGRRLICGPLKKQEISKLITHLLMCILSILEFLGTTTVVSTLESEAFLGGDLKPFRTLYANTFQALGGNTASLGSYVNCVGAIGSVLVENPNEEQKAQIAEKVQNYINAGIDLIKSQPGLENFETDPDIINEPKFALGWESVNQFKNKLLSLVVNPEKAYDHFRNIEDKYTPIVISALIQLSKEVQAIKAAKTTSATTTETTTTLEPSNLMKFLKKSLNQLEINDFFNSLALKPGKLTKKHEEKNLN
jgi:hypothetical protein